MHALAKHANLMQKESQAGIQTPDLLAAVQPD